MYITFYKLYPIRKTLYLFILNIFFSFGFSQENYNYYEALRFKSELSFQKSYRILKTKLNSLDSFQNNYPGTNITLEKIIRYYLHTSILLNQDENLLISMDSSEFKLNNSISAEEITKEVISLIKGMYFGLDEVKRIELLANGDI